MLQSTHLHYEKFCSEFHSGGRPFTECPSSLTVGETTVILDLLNRTKTNRCGSRSPACVGDVGQTRSLLNAVYLRVLSCAQSIQHGMLDTFRTSHLFSLSLSHSRSFSELAQLQPRYVQVYDVYREDRTILRRQDSGFEPNQNRILDFIFILRRFSVAPSKEPVPDQA